MTSIVRTIAEVGLGLLFLVGAVFNASYTLRHGDEFYGSFAANAWLPSARTFMRRVVIPRATVITAMLILLQVCIAALILARGDLARVGLIAGAVFSLAAALVSSRGGAIANLCLAGVLALLASGA
jgi:hypothetical protein